VHENCALSINHGHFCDILDTFWGMT